MRNKQTRRSLSQKVADKSANRSHGSGDFSYLVLPENVKTFKPKKEGNYRFNIIPYVAGTNNRDSKEGELDYEFTFWIHRIENGDNTRSIVCPKKTYGKPCPICEQVEKLSRNYAENEEEIKALKAKQRELFNIVDARDEEQVIQVYDTSYFHGFGEMLDSRLRNFDDDDEDEDFKNFADIPGGRTLKVRFNEGSFNGNKFFAPSSIDFMERKEELDESIIDSAVCLDSCLKVLSYEQIVKLLAGTEDIEEKDSSEEKPTPKRATKAVKTPEEDEDEEEEEEEPPKHKKLAKKPAPVEEEDEDEDEEDEEEEKPAPKKKSLKKPEPEEDDDNEEEDEEEEPVKPSKKLKRKPAEEEEEDEEDDEEEEEKPAPKKSSKKPAKEEEEDDEEEEEEDKKPSKKKSESKKKSCGGKCPYGHTFGADVFIYTECDNCEFVEECDAAQED